MDKLLNRNGLYDTRHQLKYSTSSSKRLSSIKKKDPDESMASTKRDIQQSRIRQCKQQSPYNDPSLIYVINKQQPINQFERTGRIQRPFHHSAKKPKSLSNLQSRSKPTVEKRRIQIVSPQVPKPLYFSSKKSQLTTQHVQKNQQMHKNNQQKINLSKPKENAKIQQIIQFLRQKLQYKCALDKHERNRILYVCLQPNCPSRIGCSYCFLHNHENHIKSEISTCIKDLQELSFKVNASEKIFTKKVRNFYAQFHEKLDHQVQNIRMEFQTNLSFVKTKVKSQFESFYKQKYLPYQEKELQTVSEFNLESSAKKQSSHLKGQAQLESGKMNAKSQNQVKEKEILTDLAELKFEEIYLYLLKRSQILHLEFAESKVLIQFFEEMNSSLTKFFSAFKRNLPKIFAQRIYLQKPLLISSS